jgi:glycosyltransferase involved in cell wall biosynthesis
MRIGLLIASLGDKGAGVQVAVRSLAATLPAQVDVCVYGGAGTGAGTEHRTFPITGPTAFGYLPGLCRTLELERPDLLHTHGLWMYPSVACIRWSGGRRPYVVSPHGMLDPWALRNSGWKKKVAGWFYENQHLRGAACLHALNAAEAKAMRSYGLQTPICVIPNGVDLPNEVPARASMRQARSLLFLGRLHPKKGLPQLVEAWSTVQVEAKKSGWELIVAGWDQNGHQSELMATVNRLGLLDSIHFVGPQFGAAKAATFKKASAFILPSLSEGLPMTILEAWAWGLPVLMTSECNLPDGFEAGAAIKIEPDADSIAAGLLRLFSMNDGELAAIGKRGRHLVECCFQWPSIAQKVESVYSWILGGPKPEAVDIWN